MAFQVLYTEDAQQFIDSLPEKARKKVLYNVEKVSEGIKDPILFKKLEGTDIWEFRTLFSGNSYRLLAFWDTEEQALVVATHGFMKKTQKTPSNEIRRAEMIMKAYFEEKKKDNKGGAK